jgi:hypothetical protein
VRIHYRAEKLCDYRKHLSPAGGVLCRTADGDSKEWTATMAETVYGGAHVHYEMRVDYTDVRNSGYIVAFTVQCQ